MSTFVLDSSAYFRLAKSFHPLLGEYGDILLKLLPDTATEFAKQPKLRSKFGWFHDEDFINNRGDNLLGLSAVDAETVKNTGFWLRDWTRDQRSEFLRRNLNPPSPTDCRVLAHAMVSGITVVADDGGLEFLAKEMDLPLIGSLRLLKRLLDVGAVTLPAIQAAAKYLDYEGDLPGSWRRESRALLGCKLP